MQHIQYVMESFRTAQKKLTTSKIPNMFHFTQSAFISIIRIVSTLRKPDVVVYTRSTVRHKPFQSDYFGLCRNIYVLKMCALLPLQDESKDMFGTANIVILD